VSKKSDAAIGRQILKSKDKSEKEIIRAHHTLTTRKENVFVSPPFVDSLPSFYF